jgi:hypothetical protein
MDLKKSRTRKYELAILRVLARASQPLDVETIRTAAGIRNWETALSHCLQLQHFGKIRGMKSSKSWTFWRKGGDL